MTPAVTLRPVAVVHALPGRVRLRVPLLHDHAALAEAIAAAAAALAGVERVEVRAYTGSVLCSYDPARASEEAILRAVKQAAASGGAAPDPATERRRLSRIARRGPGVTQAAAALFKGVDADLLRATDGRLDLADATALGLLAIAGAKVVTSRTLPLPSWFDLLWYAYNVFSREERSAIARIPHPLAPG